MHDLPLEETADGFAAGVQASDEVTAATHQCPVALRGVGTPLAVSEWRRLPTKVRQALLPSADDLSATVTRTLREIESAAPVALSGAWVVGGTCELFSEQVEIGLERVVAEGFRVGEEYLDGQQPCSGVVLHAVLLNSKWTMPRGPGR
jgi:hypothetical protein